ncbi:MAG: hypothetical protein ACR652_21865 [Methylocystis sp.]|uniref:hypothetical protein n=1 Tax=Methylocystis sp. TaxID=1911079 RepID=UPI003DA592E8
MKNYFAILLGLWPILAQSAAAHHLDEYDERIRREANLPSAWFQCKSEKDCDLVSVPCQSDLAVNANHKEEARDALIKQYPFCLGTSLHDTKASCQKHECVTEGTKPSDQNQ